MKTRVCAVCGYQGKTKDIILHRIIPEEVVEEGEMSASGTVELCINCRNELFTWYSRKVSDQIYDTAIKRFRHRLPAEMVKEYEAAYRAFAEYKNRQRKRR